MTYTIMTGTKGGVAILVKKDIIVNQEWKNEHFNVITDNEALAIEIELQNGDTIILATENIICGFLLQNYHFLFHTLSAH